MEQIGWSLVKDGAEVQFWGDKPGQCAGQPDLIRLPNGDHVHCPQPGAVQDWALVPRMYDWGPSASGPMTNGVQTIVTGALSALKADLKAQVAVDAESCRLRFITPGAGQAMTYLEKHNQANAVHDMGQSQANSLTETEYKSMFPTLAASVGVEAPTLWDAAQLVIARYEAWVTISYSIERARIAGSKAIIDASDAAAAQAAYEAITWPRP